MHVELASLVATAAVIPCTLAVVSLRRRYPWPVTFVLGHIAIAGFAVAYSSAGQRAHLTTGLLGKVSTSAKLANLSCALSLDQYLPPILQRQDGSIAWWGKSLFWPYHAALRSKLAVQKLYSTENPYDKIMEGW